MGRKWVSEKHEKFLAEYETTIKSKVDSSFNNYHEREDVKQEVRLELIKAYKSHKKYADWPNIVKGIINRRIIDYRKRLYKAPLFTDLMFGQEVDQKLNDSLAEKLIHQSRGLHEEGIDNIGLSDYIETLWNKFAEYNKFDDWEMEYLVTLFDRYDEGDIELDDEQYRMQLMGYESADEELCSNEEGDTVPKTFGQRVRQLNKKIEEIFEHENRVV